MATCDCDNLSPLNCLDIPPGLTAIPRQYLAFSDFRRNMKNDIGLKTPLSGWRAEGEQDLGMMLVDMWAYVLDVTQFYDGVISNETYLLTCKLNQSASHVIALLGYHPAPALSATVSLIAQVSGNDTIKVKAGTAFRSEAFDDQAPQIFTTLTEHVLKPEHNMWEIAPIPGDIFSGKVLFHPRHSSIPRHGILVFKHGDHAIHAGQISSVNSLTGPDERSYIHAALEGGHAPLEGLPLDELKTRLMGRKARPSEFSSGSFDSSKLVLDGVYPRIRKDDIAVLEVNDQLYPFIIANEKVIQVTVATNPSIEVTTPDGPITVPQADIKASATEVTLPSISGLTLEETTEYTLHFYPVRVGKLIAPAKTELALDDIAPAIDLEKPRFRLQSDVTSNFVLQGLNALGEKYHGTVAKLGEGQDYKLSEGSNNLAFAKPLQTPVRAYGNLISATRAERVKYEIIGSVSGQEDDLKFKLKKSPLSWIEDGNAPRGRRPLLDVYVNSVKWTRVGSLYHAGPSDRVYIVETDLDENSFITFGDGKKGERPASGNKNIIADYHYGAGAAKPPADGIKQVVGSVKGLKKIKSPLIAQGGKDADSADEIKINAPLTMLTLDRAISVQDFEALAYTFAGVVNVTAGWSWSQSRQAAVVSLWVIGETGSIDNLALQTWLLSFAADNTQLEVLNATADLKTLNVSLKVLSGYNIEQTHTAIRTALLDSKHGYLAYNNIPIGLPIYRSEILARIHNVEGVENVSSILVDGVEMEWGLTAHPGHYFDFTSGLELA